MTAPSGAFTVFTVFTYQPLDLMFNRINNIKTTITYSLSLPYNSKYLYIVDVIAMICFKRTLNSISRY